MQNTTEFIKSHKLEIILSFAAGLFIIFLVSFFVGLNAILSILDHTDLKIMLFTLVLELIMLFIWAVRWRLILHILKKAPNFKQLFLMLLASIFGNNVTPGAAGGEPLRAYLLDKFENVPFELGFASTTADRVFEFFPFVLISILTIYLIFTLNVGFWTSLIISIVILLIIIFFGLLVYVGYKKEVATRLVISIAKRVYPIAKRFTSKETSFTSIHDKLMEYVEIFTTGFQGVLKDRKMFIVGILISFLMWGIDNLRFYFTFVAIGYHPPILPVVIIYTVAFVVSILPTIPGSLGIREGVMVALFLPVGVSPDVVIAVALLDRVVSYIIPTFMGAFATFYFGKKYKNIKENSKVQA